MFIVGVARTYGLEPLADGTLLVNLTRTHLTDTTIDFPLITGAHAAPSVLNGSDISLVNLSQDRVSGTYRPANDGEVLLRIAAPEGHAVDDGVQCEVNATTAPCTTDSSSNTVMLALELTADIAVEFEVVFS